MPTVADMPPLPPPLEPPRKVWNGGDCDILESAGLLEGQHLELVQGELISKMGKKRPHVNTLTLLTGWLMDVFGIPFVNPGAPIDVAPEDNPTNEPEPDVIVLKSELSNFITGNPRPEDLRLVVEVADTSPKFDLTTLCSRRDCRILGFRRPRQTIDCPSPSGRWPLWVDRRVQ